MTANVMKGRGRQVLDYLDEHRLDPTSQNYAFAHHFLFEDDKVFRDAVGEITEGGVRITARQVEQLAPMFPPSSRPRGDVAPELDALTPRVLEIARSAADTTGGLNRDLLTAMAALLSPEGRDLDLVISTMIDHTAEAEASLGDASRRAQAVREELSALRSRSLQDQVTGLLNREGMKERLEAAHATGEAFSMAVIEIDRLQEINQEYGAGVRDRVLKVVAGTLGEGCSPHTVSRWTEGQFLALFEGMAVTDASSVLAATRATLVKRRLKLRENDAPLGPISFSVGVASSRARDVDSVLSATVALLAQKRERGRAPIVAEQPKIGL